MFLYHETEDEKVFSDDDVFEAKKNGWVEDIRDLSFKRVCQYFPLAFKSEDEMGNRVPEKELSEGTTTFNSFVPDTELEEDQTEDTFEGPHDVEIYTVPASAPDINIDMTRSQIVQAIQASGKSVNILARDSKEALIQKYYNK